ncbi:hypothetical protein [Paenibacillus ferrarius]|uniref:hypothetical protein n=1 Tax=Paenibacillus ferrarius TaxID=1469647 RepID=UPI003D2749BF
MIYNFFSFFYDNHGVSGLAGFCSILGLLLSIYLLYIANGIKKGIKKYSQVKDFNANRDYNMNRLIGLKDLFVINNVFDNKLITDLSVEIHKFKNYWDILRYTEKRMISKSIHYLSRDLQQIDKIKLRNKLVYLINLYSANREELI